MRIIIFLFGFTLLGQLHAQDKENDVLLVSVGESYNRYSDVAVYLQELFTNTPDLSEIQVDIEERSATESLADGYYDPGSSEQAVRAAVASGYGHVILIPTINTVPHGTIEYTLPVYDDVPLDNEFFAPEVFYEGCKQLSTLIYSAGSTPLILLPRNADESVTETGQAMYRVANGVGMELIPAAYAMESAGLTVGADEEGFITACAIFTQLTGLNANVAGYTPAGMSSSDAMNYADIAETTVNTHHTTEHYTTSYENEGAVVYRALDVASEPFNNVVRYRYKGTSTQDWTRDAINALVNADENTSPAYRKLGRRNGVYTSGGGVRYWHANDLPLRAAAIASEPDQAQFMYVTGSIEGSAQAQELIDLDQANIIPLVFDWIKSFAISPAVSGTAATTDALIYHGCSDTYYNYVERGWKIVPLVAGMGRLNEAIPNFVASHDALHMSDLLVYMNAYMMLSSSLGTEFPIPTDLSDFNIHRGSPTLEQLTLACEIGHGLVKEHAFLSETGAYVPDSDLTIETDSLPDLPLQGAYGVQLTATGGTGGYLWELIADTTLPDGLSLTVNGLLHGTVTETGTWNVAFKVRDGRGAFRKVGLKLSSAASVEAADFTVLLTSYDPATISLPGDDSGTLTYAYATPSNGALSGTGPDLTYTPNAGITGDSFTYTITSGGVTSVVKTVTIQMALPDGQGVGAPEAYSTTAVVDEDGTVEIPLTGFDAEGDSLIARIISDPSHGTLGTVVNNVVTYEPDAGFYGSDSFTFKMNDGGLDSATATLMVTVSPVNDSLPVAEALSITVVPGESAAVTLMGSDDDGDSLTYSMVSSSTHGTLEGTEPDLIYTPNAGYIGSDSFTYKVNDGFDDSNVATVSIEVASSIEYSFETAGHISGTTTDIVYTAPDTNTFGEGVTLSSLELSDSDNVSYYGRIENVGGDSAEAAVGDRAVANTVEFTVNISDAVVVNLSRIRFDTYYFTSATGTSVMDWTFETIVGTTASNTTTGGFLHDGVDNYQSPEEASGDIELSGLSGLTDTSVTFRWTLNGDKNHTFTTRNMGLDDIVLTGISAEAASYLAWTFSHDLAGDDALATADIENGVGDGYSNLLEFALGMDPAQSDAGSRDFYSIEANEGAEYFVYEYYRRSDYLDLGLSYTLVVTSDLVTPITDPAYAVVVEDPVNGYEKVSAWYAIEDDAKFIQLNVETSSP